MKLTMPTLLTFIGIIGAIVAPVIYVGAIKENVAVNSNRITTIETNQIEMRADIKQILNLLQTHTFETTKKLPMFTSTSTSSK